jgi:hypothetical protein
VNEYHEFTLREMLPECNFIVEDNDGYGFRPQ